MLALIISILTSAACVIAGKTYHISNGATIAAGIAGFLIPQLLIGYIVRKKTAAINEELQNIVLSGQKRINQLVNQFQFKPGGDPKRMQRQIEKDQAEIFKKSLEFTDNLEPFKKWNLFMGKQISTMRLQFLYQLNEFEQVDKILFGGFMSSPLMMDPVPVAMKMARQFKNKKSAAAEKTFKRSVIWFRGSRAKLLYGVMSWIYMKDGESDKARELLLKGKEVTTDQTLANNWMALANGKDNKFSNAGLGDEWFALYLEKPPAPKQQRVRQNKKGHRPF